VSPQYSYGFFHNLSTKGKPGQLSRQASNRLLIVYTGSRGLHLLCLLFDSEEVPSMQFQPPSGTTQYPPSQPLPPQSPAMQPAPRPPKKHLKKRWIALAAIVLIVIISVIANGSHGSSPGASVTPTAQPTQATTQAATTATTQLSQQANRRRNQPRLHPHSSRLEMGYSRLERIFSLVLIGHARDQLIVIMRD